MATYAAQSIAAHAGTQQTWQTPASGDLAPTGPAPFAISFTSFT